jgi:filamentous hemagglutinin family protein
MSRSPSEAKGKTMNHTGSELLHTMLLATSALVASTMLTSMPALAGGPTGGKVAVGNATITNPSSTQTVVDQTSQKALINWNSFSLPTGSTITFDQPNKTSLTVNRVTGANASTIDGQLLANGNIWLINANGIMFGHGSQVDVGALLATTSDLSDDDFRKGRYRFTKPGNPGASVVNQGCITAAPGGSVVLSGSQVSNQGVIQANLGTVVLGGANAFTVDLDGDNLLRYQITAPVTASPKGTPNSGSALVSNSGTIAAAGGRILLTARAAKNVQDDVINNTGQIEATSVSSHDGEIDFDAGPDGAVNVGGTVNALGTAAGETGGAINVAGGTVNVINGATINASGDVGGGTIQIGGGLHGKGSIANSNATNIGNATISANAITNGNGGTVAIWSNGMTSFSGTVSATGGTQGGNGGLVETSGGNVQVGNAGKVITSATRGATGDWLLDPTNIDISTDGTDGIGGSNISPNTIIGALGSTNVTLEATNDITVFSDVDYSSSNALSLLASHDITVEANVQNSGTGAINLIAGWDGVTTNLSSLTNPGVYGNNSGSITLQETANNNIAVGSAGGTTTLAGDNLDVIAASGWSQVGYHGAGGGDIVVDLTGNLTLTSNFSGGVAQIGNGSLAGDVSGNITGNISINAAGTTTINVGEGGVGTLWLGNFAGEGNVESGNVSLITGTADFGNFGANIVADLGGANQPGSGGDFLIGFTNQDINLHGGGNFSGLNSPHNFTLLSVDNVNLSSTIQNSGTGNITVVAGWDGVTTNLSQLTNAGVYGNNGGTITIGGQNANGNAAVGSAGGTTTFAAADLTIESDNGYAQAGYHGAGGGDIVVDLTGNLTLTSNYSGGVAQLGNGSLAGDVSGNITGNISINAAGTTTINVGEGGGTAWIGNFAGEGSIESGNVSLITGSGNLGNFGANVVADLGSTSQAGSGGDFLLGSTNHDIDINNGGGNVNSPHNFTLLSVDNVILGSSIENSGTGNITVVAGWDGTTTNLASLTNAGVYGNNGGTITIGGPNANGNVSVGSAGGTTTFAAANLTIESDYGYAQAGYHGAGGGDLVADLTGNLTLTSYDGGEGNYAQFGNGSLNGDVSGNITGNISINAAGTTTINVGEGASGNAWIGNFASEDSIESGNVTLITGYVQNGVSFGNADSLGSMLIADLGTTSASASGGNVTLALANPQTDFINNYLDMGAFAYNSPNSLTLLSTDNITLPYSIQNDGTGNLTILAGWNSSVAPANVLTTPNAYGQNSGFVWVVGETGSLVDYNPNSGGGQYVDSGAGVAIGSMGGTTTIGAAQIYIEGLSGYAQIGYHNSGGTGAINVVANGVPGTGGLTGVSACFDGNANICVIGGRSGDTNANNDPSYAQIGDLGLGVAGTASANINISATGNVAVAGGGIYNNGEGGTDPQIVNAYGMIGNGDGAQTVSQTVSGTINVNVTGQLNFASSTGAGSEAWLGNRTGTGGLASGDLTVMMGSENDSGPINFGDMIFADLGSTSQSGSGGNVIVGQTSGSIDIQSGSGFLYDSPNNLTLLSADNIDVQSSMVNSGTGDITLIAGWNPSIAPASVLTTPGAYGLNNGTVDVGDSSANGNVAVGSMTGTTTVAGAEVDVVGLNGYAQIGFPGSGGSGTINVYATSSAPPVYNQNSAPCLTGSGNVCIASGSSTGFYAQIGNGGYGMTGTSSGNINVAATGNVVLIGGSVSVSDGQLIAGNTVGSYAMIGNGDASQVNAATVGGDISITVGGETYLDSGSDPSSPAWIGNRTGSDGSEQGALTLITGTENDQGTTTFRGMIVAGLGAGDGSGGDVVLGFTDPNNTLNINHAVSYSSSNSLTILAVSNIALNSTFQNSGSGDITVMAGWDGHTLGSASQLESANAYGLNDATFTIGGTNAPGDASIGTAGGTMTVLTDNLDIESDNGIAQLGYTGAGTGNINVVALGNVTVDALTGSYAQIGNGGSAVAGNVGGAIGVSSSGTILVESDATQSNAVIGNIGGATSSESGGITLGANTIDINSVGQESNAFVGNGSVVASTGGATGDIGITSGDLSIDASGDGSNAFIGDGVRFNSSGTTGGNIDVNSATLEIVANEPDSATSEARIANRGSGSVVGTYDIVTTGDIQMSASDGNLAAIGNGENGTGTSSGSLTVQSGGTLTLASINGGETRIGNGAASDSTVDVSAAGDITLSVTGNPGEFGSGSVLIGNLGGAVGGNVSVTSTGGSIDLNAAEDRSAIQIGNIQNGVTANVSGNVTVSAQDNVTLEAAGQNSTVQIGNGGAQTQGNDTGTVQIAATTGEIAATLNGDGGFIQLGNGGNASVGTATGDTSLTAGTSLQLSVGGSAADSGSYIQVGDGSTFDATSGGGNIAVNATSMSTSNSVDFVGNSLAIALTGAGDSIGANSELRVTVNDFALTTNNGSAFVYSTQGISLGAGEGGIDLGTGGLDLASAGAVTQTNAITASSANVSTTSGAITLTNASNAITLANLSTSGSDDATLYDTADLTMTGADVGGNLTLLTKGNLTFTDSALAGGSILAVAGWDGTTTSPSALTTGTAYGNNSGSITIGGASQDGNVDIGSATGSTTLAADNVSLTANNGYVQVGYNGAGSGAIDVVALGNVTLTAGTEGAEFAQIGNGGWNTSGNESGSITVDAAGAVALNGGSGQETYAQIGHGGTGSNSSSEGYNDTGLITVDGQAVTLAAGSSQGSYVQIGNGGYQSGQNSSGTLTLGGDINVNSISAVTLTGNGQDAYAQIGNGGDFVNEGAANNTTGMISGNIDVLVADASNHTSPDPVSATAGSGADSYAQIGNGGNGENSPANGATVTFTVSGNITVADLTLQGSDTGQDGYAQVGNGDASKTGTGDISGDITIGPGIDVTIDNGTAPGTDTMIGNDTGFGTVTGTITGYTTASSNPTSTPSGNGAVATTTDTPVTPTDTDVNVVTVTPENGNPDQPGNNPAPINQPPGPLDQLADNGNSEGTDPSDALTSSLGQSLDPHSHNAPITTVKSIIPGVLTEVVMKDAHGPHGVPPADEDYSSWGNEALWRW